MSKPHIHLDTPLADASYPPQRFPVTGWLWLGERHADLAALEAWVDGECVGRTRHFYARPDVSAHLGVAASERTAFQFCGSLPPRPTDREGGPAELRIVARLRPAGPGETAPDLELTRGPLGLLPDQRGELPYGFLLDPASAWVLHRENIYGSGPSVGTCDLECLALLQRYLPPPPARVLDVGCGLGVFAGPLLAAGYDWCGAEVKSEDCADLARRGLPHRQVTPGEPLPFADGEFDAAICTEVLEHIEDTAFFLGQIARVVRRQAIFSVPNSELIPLLSVYQAVPWHLLEADHKNFFTRFNLRALLAKSFAEVEIFDYRMHQLGHLKGQDWPYHLLAVAEHDTP